MSAAFKQCPARAAGSQPEEGLETGLWRQFLLLSIFSLPSPPSFSRFLYSLLKG